MVKSISKIIYFIIIAHLFGCNNYKKENDFQSIKESLDKSTQIINRYSENFDNYIEHCLKIDINKSIYIEKYNAYNKIFSSEYKFLRRINLKVLNSNDEKIEEVNKEVKQKLIVLYKDLYLLLRDTSIRIDLVDSRLLKFNNYINQFYKGYNESLFSSDNERNTMLISKMFLDFELLKSYTANLLFQRFNIEWQFDSFPTIDVIESNNTIQIGDKYNSFVTYSYNGTKSCKRLVIDSIVCNNLKLPDKLIFPYRNNSIEIKYNPKSKGEYILNGYFEFNEIEGIRMSNTPFKHSFVVK